jgi:8-oxo-dGTP pyrophosphatase MutT (NUDIX family)
MKNIAAIDLLHHRIPGGLDIDTVHADPKIECINVHCWVLSSDGKFVLMQRRSPKVLTYADKYDISMAGHVDGDEQPLEAMLRETYEEGAIDLAGRLIEPDSPIYVAEEGRYAKGAPWLHNQSVYVYFAILDPSEISLTAGDDEVSSFEWWSLDTFALRAANPMSKRLVPHPNWYYQLVIKNLYALSRSRAKIAA